MMNDQKFPELHDIGKLVDEKVKDGVNIKCQVSKNISMDMHSC